MKLKNVKILTYIVLFNSIITTIVYPIQQKTALFGTASVALLSAVASYKAWLLSNKQIHPAIFYAPSSLLIACAYHHLQSITPQGRLNRATILLNDLSQHILINNSFSSDNAFFDAVHDVYLTDDLPLISAYNHLIELLPNAHYAFSLISSAASQAEKNSPLQEACETALLRAKKLFTNMSNAIKLIRAHKDYLTQLQIYKEFLANEKQLASHQQMVIAQQNIAHAQQSSNLLKWLKALFWGR